MSDAMTSGQLTIVDLTDDEPGRNLLLDVKDEIVYNNEDKPEYLKYVFTLSDYGKEKIVPNSRMAFSFKMNISDRGDDDDSTSSTRTIKQKNVSIYANYYCLNEDEENIVKNKYLFGQTIDINHAFTTLEHVFNVPLEINEADDNGDEVPCFIKYLDSIYLQINIAPDDIEESEDSSEEIDKQAILFSVQIEEEKLEFGEKSTTWVPSIETEVKSLLDSLDSTVSTLDSGISSLNLNLSNLNDLVSCFNFLDGNFVTITDASAADHYFNAISSSNYQNNPSSSIFSETGTAIDFVNGNIYSENFAINGGSAYFKGNIEAEGIINATGGSIGGFSIATEADGSPVLKTLDNMSKISNKGTVLPANNFSFSFQKNNAVQTISPFEVNSQGSLIFNSIRGNNEKTPSLMLSNSGLFLFDTELSKNVPIDSLGAEQAVAFIQQDLLYINKAQIVSRHIVGDFGQNGGGYGFITRSNGHMALKWMTSPN